jgi:hypothetical protein
MGVSMTAADEGIEEQKDKKFIFPVQDRVGITVILDWVTTWQHVRDILEGAHAGLFMQSKNRRNDKANIVPTNLHRDRAEGEFGYSLPPVLR